MTIQYYDRFDKQKLWDRLMFVAGRDLQTAELNELQSLFDWKLKKLSDIFISEGTPISGCVLISPGSFPNPITISEGYVYMNGKIIYTEEQQTIGNFIGTGIEWVYVDASEEIDKSPTDFKALEIEEPNFEVLGSYRKNIKLKFYNKDNKTPSSILFDFVRDGNQLFKRPTFGANKVIEFVEDRTFEENGNFFVRGGDLTLKEPTNTSTYNLIVSPYTVFMQGRRYITEVPQVINVSKPVNTFEAQDFVPVSQAIDNESPNTKNVFLLNTDYVKELVKCVYPVRVLLTINHALIGDIDNLNVRGSIAEVLKVQLPDASKEFIEGADYDIDYDDIGLDWSRPGDEPTVGTTYEVDIVYYKTLEMTDEGADQLISIRYPQSLYGDYQQANLVILDLTYYSTNTSHIINPEYLSYKHKIDAVVLNEDTGIVNVVQGDSVADYSSAVHAKLQSSDIILYWVRHTPGSYSDPKMSEIKDKRVFRLTQTAFNTLLNKSGTLDSDLINLELKRDILKSAEGFLKATYFNSLNNQDYSNIDYNGSKAEFPNPFDADFDDDTLTLPLNINNLVGEVSKQYSTLNEGKRAFTLPYSTLLFVSQQLATDSIPVVITDNFYKMHTLEVDPIYDYWMDYENVTLITQGDEQISERVQSINQIRGTGATKKLLKDDRFSPLNIPTSLQVYPRVRPRTLSIAGRFWFIPDSLGSVTLKVSVAGIELTGINPILQPNGNFTGNITIPSNIPLGPVPIRVWTDPEYLEAFILYYAEGILDINTKHKRIKTVDDLSVDPVDQISVREEGVRAVTNQFKWRDSMAQTFSVSKDMFLTSVGLYFKTRSNTAPIVCYIAKTEDDYPTDIYIAKSIKPENNVNVSNNSLEETVFHFGDPVYLQKGNKYVIILVTSSIDYTVFVAEQDTEDLLTQKKVVSQPFNGVFFTSINGATWSVFHEKALKFNLYRAEFGPTGELYTNVQNINNSWFMILANIAEHGDTTVSIYHKADIQLEWTEVELGRKVHLLPTDAAFQNQVRFLLQTPDSWVSPVLSRDLDSIYWSYKTSGHWYSNELDFGEDNKYNKIKVILHLVSSPTNFVVNLIASSNQTAWQSYTSTSITPIITTVDFDIPVIKQEFVFDISGDFSVDLARYLMLNIELIGDPQGSDTPRLFDMKVAVYEKI